MADMLLTRRKFLMAAGVGIAGASIFQHRAFGAIVPEAPGGTSLPNIIVIVADDLGYNGLGCYGCPDIPTPHIDSLAANGIRFTQAYVSCPVCSPTRAGLMTGRYQQRFGHEFNFSKPEGAGVKLGLPLTETTMATRLKAAGYATGLVGKWHLGSDAEYMPMKRGFDEFFGFLGGSHSYVGSDGKGIRTPMLRGTARVPEKEYLTAAFAREAEAFIERHKAGPFFLYLPFNAVHSPMEAQEEYLERFKGIADKKRRTHAAMLASFDDAVGQVLQKLRDLDLEKNTLICFFSDNGGAISDNTSRNDPLRGGKASLLEGGIRIPTIVQFKGRLPAGKVYDQPAIQLDILPTALTAAGVKVLPEWKLDGVNLLPYLDGTAKGAPHETLYWRFGAQWAVRHANLKLVQSLAGTGRLTEPELYDVVGDPGEKMNLAGKHPDKVKELRAVWESWNAQLTTPLWPSAGGGQPKGEKPGKPDAKPAPDKMESQNVGEE
jgi:arylsulfatase A-like enzyme